MQRQDKPGSATESTLDSRGRLGDESSTFRTIRRGDARGAALLYDLFGQDVDRLVWKILGADQDHDDVVHNVFLKVLSSVGRVRDLGSLGVWIRKVTVSTVYSELRRRRVRRLVTDWEPDPDRFAFATNDEDTRIRLCDICAVLDRLKSEQRLLIVLRHLEGYSLAELAEALGVSLRTCKRRLPRAEQRFRLLAGAEPSLRGWLASNDKEGEPG